MIAIIGMLLIMALIYYIWASWFVVEPVCATVCGLLCLGGIALFIRVLIACSNYDDKDS